MIYFKEDVDSSEVITKKQKDYNYDLVVVLLFYV